MGQKKLEIFLVKIRKSLAMQFLEDALILSIAYCPWHLGLIMDDDRVLSPA
jgi:hypothetical protein